MPTSEEIIYTRTDQFIKNMQTHQNKLIKNIPDVHPKLKTETHTGRINSHTGECIGNTNKNQLSRNR